MSLVKMVTATGEEHGLINTLTNHVPFDDFKAYSPADAERLRKEKKEDSKMVEAQYLNARGGHERLEKVYCKYAGDPIQQWRLIPNRTYKLPLGMIKEVNDESKHLKRREGLVSIDDKNVTSTGAPLASDQDGGWLHKLVPVNF